MPVAVGHDRYQVCVVVRADESDRLFGLGTRIGTPPSHRTRPVMTTTSLAESHDRPLSDVLNVPPRGVVQAHE
ncbi:hypothetical protein DFR68_102801 [Nocardia mexicana]|uniref:Uncharacterized protein n=1 Tax=Nocardia mexicana TaxID=279262 RepID=A0A370HDW0_9NOCA|nr:hypothetical protein DFR68_102801 [Nocardia mexicana]